MAPRLAPWRGLSAQFGYQGAEPFNVLGMLINLAWCRLRCSYQYGYARIDKPSAHVHGFLPPLYFSCSTWKLHDARKS